MLFQEIIRHTPDHFRKLNCYCHATEEILLDITIRKSTIKEQKTQSSQTCNAQKERPSGLAGLGWNIADDALPPELLGKNTIARVTGVRKNRFLIHDGKDEYLATAMGKLYHQADGGLFPATGDWVLMHQGQIVSVLPRKNALARGASGQQGKRESTAVKTQVIATNLDRVFIVCGLDRDFNPRRIERYLTLVYNCGCTPVVVLSKADLIGDPTAQVHEIESIAFGVPVLAISAKTGAGLTDLAPHLGPGTTVALLGSSGAGKSTLLNALAGEEIQATREVSRYAGKGVHTTTTRDLIRLPGGALLIDNPGIREIAFWDVDDGARSAFPEIEALAGHCRFADCTHTGEPGCRVREANEKGELSDDRLSSYIKQQRELDYLAQRETKSAERLEKDRWKGVTQEIRKMKKIGNIVK